MDFFEQLGKKLTDTGQNVARQTKNLADVTQLNNAISEREKKVSQLLLSIGQAYYERHKNDSAAEELSLIEEVNSLQAEIAQNREKIKQIKGIVKCPNCGADVPFNAAFCSNCGAKAVHDAVLPETSAEDAGNVRYCPNCHAAVAKDDLFCNICGTKMDKGGDTI